ncbi:MAG TPA: hypothetical protein ENI27_01020 [bacterium]|nr:hypothetical protein [bacterium]
MGVEKNVGLNKMPRQGTHLGIRVKVCFNDDADNTIGGRVIREDMEEPFRTIIALDDERVVLATECQYQPTYWRR